MLEWAKYNISLRNLEVKVHKPESYNSIQFFHNVSVYFPLLLSRVTPLSNQSEFKIDPNDNNDISTSLYSLSSFLCHFLLLLPFAWGRMGSSSSGVSQTLLVCGDDVVVESLVKLGDDVTPAVWWEDTLHSEISSKSN